ncbi:MAG: RnfABCDGE type electron transport complex subunit G [Granulosicoccus sp.]
MSTPARSAIILAISVGLALLMLTIINALTEQRIIEARRHWMLDNLSSVLPDGPFDSNPVDSVKKHIEPSLGSIEPLELYTAYQSGKPAAAVLEIVTMEGYSGMIRLLLGLLPDGSIVAVRVIEHKETPGLGDAIEKRKSDWIRQFELRSLSSNMPKRWQLKNSGGQFDGLTGATITSNAVIRAVHRAVSWYDVNKHRVFDKDITDK